jgi:hypothetical protein
LQIKSGRVANAVRRVIPMNGFTFMIAIKMFYRQDINF